MEKCCKWTAKKKKKDGKKSQNEGKKDLKKSKEVIQFIIAGVGLITHTHTSPHASRCQNRASLVV